MDFEGLKERIIRSLITKPRHANYYPDTEEINSALTDLIADGVIVIDAGILKHNLQQPEKQNEQ